MLFEFFQTILRRSLLAVSFCGAAGLAELVAQETVERRLGVMGTDLVVKVGAATRMEALQVSEIAVRALEDAEARLSSWQEESELSRLNRTAVGDYSNVSQWTAVELRRACEWTESTQGAFDLGCGRLLQAWSLVPDSSGELELAVADSRSRTARRFAGKAPLEWRRSLAASVAETTEVAKGWQACRSAEEVQLTAGAFGKGAGLDAALRALNSSEWGRAESEGAKWVLMDLGGQLAVFGDLPSTPELSAEFGVAHPQFRDRTVLSVELQSGSLATSGNSERGFQIEGVEHGHILDPVLGLPAPNFGSVTVWAANGLDADCLSTALFVMGPERGLAFAEELSDVEAVFLHFPTHSGSDPFRTSVPSAGQTLVATATSGWKQRLRQVGDVSDLSVSALQPSCDETSN